MRRILFNTSVALLAFGIGSFVVFNFSWKETEKPLAVENSLIEKKSSLFLVLNPKILKMNMAVKMSSLSRFGKN